MCTTLVGSIILGLIDSGEKKGKIFFFRTALIMVGNEEYLVAFFFAQKKRKFFVIDCIWFMNM